PQADRGVLVLATESTVRGGAYAHEILARNPAGRIYSRPCPLLVALAEEGRNDDELARLALAEYIAPAVQALPEISSVVLGCTHFPVFRGALADLLDPSIRVVDSAQTTAAAVSELLRAKDLLATTGAGAVTLLATDGVRRFRRVGAQFLGEAITELELVDL
ncbi:MAG: glutamate racemase, partial [Pseudomonadales bacterium]